MSLAENKADRLLKIEALLLAHPEGLSQAELARRLGVNRSTINRDLPDLPKQIYAEVDGRWKIDRAAYLVNVRLNLNEALALHLATRLLATRTDRQNPHAAAALRKLGVSLEKLAPRISRHMLQSADRMDDSREQRQDPVYLAVLERLTLAWAEQRVVRVWHRHVDDRVFEYDFEPYFIEPYAVGQTTHVIGLRRPPGAVRTFKIERLERVELLRESYDLPPDFNPQVFLRSAWGIWFSEGEPVRVILQFSTRAARRVKETRWHPTQELQDLPSGGVLWQADVAEPQEMLPWVRGWGADVEVMGPKELRHRMEVESRAAAELYGWGVQEKPAKDGTIGTCTQKALNQLLAHLSKDKRHQSLKAHLDQVSQLTGLFARKVRLEPAGKLLGRLHDLGKASRKFQNYLASAGGLIDPDQDEYVDPLAEKGRIDHSTAGAQWVYQQLKDKNSQAAIAAQVLAVCVSSHHSGLIDCLSTGGQDIFQLRMEKPEEAAHTIEVLAALGEAEKQAMDQCVKDERLLSSMIQAMKVVREENDDVDTYRFKSGLLARFLFSCLIDADRIDTSDFEYPADAWMRNDNQATDWKQLAARLEQKLDSFACQPHQTKLNLLRSEISQSCLEAASRPHGIYTLDVPTGGGKTLASLRFALNHAALHDMERVFYILPYTSIIDQNADEVRKILEERNALGQLMDKVVLEHHSNLTPDEETKRQGLLSQNWDAPVIFTTQVQFLEALFGAGTRGARRMHRLAKAVLIFDEVQTLPLRCVHMFNLALRFLVKSCGSTAVLCTATQPLLDQVTPARRALSLGKSKRLVANVEELFAALRRVNVYDRRKPGGWGVVEMAQLAAQQLEEMGSVLVITNTRASARALFLALSEDRIGPVYHLSTNMCPAHRMRVLNELKERLASKLPVICVSTQLIEAGVDVDFGAVIRSLAGLDSIVQAAGRCNRNGAPTPGKVWIVNPQFEDLRRLAEIRAGREKTEVVLDQYLDNSAAYDHDLLGLKAVTEYFRMTFFSRSGEMSYPVGKDSPAGQDDNLFNLLSSNTHSVEAYRRVAKATPSSFLSQSFQTAAKCFHAIETETRGVIVPYGDEGPRMITELRNTAGIHNQLALLRKAQRFTINLYAEEFERLLNRQAIQETQKDTGIFYLDEQFYDSQLGWRDEIVSQAGPISK